MLEKLEIDKLIAEINFLNKEIDIKECIINELETDFNTELEKIISENEAINNQWSETLKNRKSNSDFDFEKNILINKSNTNEKVEKVDINVKNIYRKIAKKTHPDKTKNSSLIDSYTKATNSYEKNNLKGLIYLSYSLDIDYDYTLLDKTETKKDLESLKTKSKLYEKNIYWKWYTNDKDSDIIKSYIAKEFFLSMKNI